MAKINIYIKLTVTRMSISDDDAINGVCVAAFRSSSAAAVSCTGNSLPAEPALAAACRRPSATAELMFFFFSSRTNFCQ